MVIAISKFQKNQFQTFQNHFLNYLFSFICGKRMSGKESREERTEKGMKPSGGMESEGIQQIRIPGRN
ncbi:MAG: hypothetical protein HUJ54_00335 [Erysipelotrichaceae bacterium]|nr:hypothetical protein [Erysipelotrichaceae bacterium]